MAYGEEVVGKRYGRMLVTALLEPIKGMVMVQALCDCGVSAPAVMWRLANGVKKSCGCLKRETTAKRNTTHGLSHLPEYKIWIGLLTRCYNKASISYKTYGKLGITVSAEWRHSFEKFYEDMGPRPSPELSVERKDNSLGYSASNCIWADDTVQNNNKSSNVVYTIDGTTKTLKKWAADHDLDYHCAYWRHQQGWDIQKILNTKSRRNRHEQTV